ncbi:MAG: hypothetical protein K2L23_05165 [Odoribacter sp.]|nr:hypothetical protein [Odoribacter sp.]
MKPSIRFLLLLASFPILSACHKDNIDADNDSTLSLNERMNQFIDTQMKDIYLWAKEIKNVKADLNKEPEEYLKTLRYSEDLWSNIEENDPDTRTSINGKEKTFGYNIQFYKITDSLVGGMIQYVYKGSPAAKAGLKRGDMIFANNGKPLTPDNYTHILTDEQAVLKTGLISHNTLYIFKEEYALSKAILQQDPILLDTVIQIGNKKIGYLVYSQFYDDQSTSLPRLSQAISQIKAASIDEFILDLRYNTGGAETAARHLGSLLAPAKHVRNQDILIQKQWNDTYQQKQHSQQLVCRFDPAVLPDNLDLQKIYILTGEHTASASEVIISGLHPYTEIILIGSQTHGKYVGMSQIIPPHDLQKWILWPVTFAYTNANGDSVKGGIPPTYSIEEYMNYLPPFGDPEDPLLAKALELINGFPPAITCLTQNIRTSPGTVSWQPLKHTKTHLLVVR